MKLNYFRTVMNFGDALSRPLVEKLAGHRVDEAADLPQCDIMATGSIGWTGRLFNPKFGVGASPAALYMWGFGFSLPYDPRRPVAANRKLDIRAVRGGLTLAALRKAGLVGTEEIVCGDPGLLYADLVPDVRNAPKEHDVAVVPHRLDWQAGSRLAEMLIAKGFSAKYVDPTNVNPFDCVRAIAASRKVLASSLHALVVADSLGIPNRRMVFSGYDKDVARQVEQSGFRFDDYYSAFGVTAPPPLQEADILSAPQDVVNDRDGFTCVARDKVAACRNALLRAFPFPHGNQVGVLSAKEEHDVCNDVARDVRLADEARLAEMRMTLSATRRDRDRWKHEATVRRAEVERQGKELKILRDARKDIEEIVYGPNAAKKKVVVFGKNLGTGGDDAVSAVIGTRLPDVAVPVRAGYDFDGYWTTVNPGGVQYYDRAGHGVRNADESIPNSLFARWEEKK